MVLQMDMVQSMALGVIVLLIGSYLVRKIDFLGRFCIPAPVVGGTLFAILALILPKNLILPGYFDWGGAVKVAVPK